MGRRGLLALLVLTSCKGDAPSSGAPQGTDAIDCATSTATWDTVGEPLMLTWCTPCHSEHLPAERRQGAPVGIDFDTYELSLPWAERIRVRVVDTVDMPPSGGMPEHQIAQVQEWVQCGAVGTVTTPPVDPCAGASPLAGDQAASAVDCTGGPVTIGGSLLLDADADLSCVCAIDGAVEAAGAVRAELPLLQRIGGDLHLADPTLQHFAAPQATEAGHLVFLGAALTTVELPELQAARSFQLEGVPALTQLMLDELYAVEGDVTITGAPAAVQVGLPRLQEVGGAYTVRGLPALERLVGTDSLHTVGGDITLEDLPRLADLSGFSELTTLEGSVVLRRTGSPTLHGFHRLTQVSGDIIVHGNTSLRTARAFADLQHVGGSFRYEGNTAFAQWDGLRFLSTVGGDFVIRDHPALLALPAMAELGDIGGDVVLTGNDTLDPAEVQALVDQLTVGGSVTLGDDTGL